MNRSDRARTPCARPRVESLEDRDLPAPLVAFDPGAGVLTINAPRQGVQATVNAAGQELVLALAGKGINSTEIFDASLVHQLVFHGGRGNDTFTNNTLIPSVATSGGGNDRLQGGGGFNALIGGPGSDTLVAGTGPNWLQGGTGKNTLVVVPGQTTYKLGSKQNKVVFRNPGQSGAPTTDPSSLAAAVLAYVESHLGTAVGDGQCGTLAVMAEQAAGAMPWNQLGPTGPTADYVWGSLVLEEAGSAGGGQAVAGSYAAVQPGDVVQFSNADFVLNTPTYNSYQSFPHHTAIIEAYLGNGQFSVLQQNVNGNMTVQRGVIDFTQLTSGTVWVYQPVPQG
jgi:Ca2+-binding RTX toxin-like protein